MGFSQCWEIKEFQGWVTVVIKDRIDSFNFSEFENDVKTFLGAGSKHLVFELSQTRFLSFKAILLLNQCAQLCRQSERRTALVAPTEKLKRQIHIYADLKPWEVFRSLNELPLHRADATASRPYDEASSRL